MDVADGNGRPGDSGIAETDILDGIHHYGSHLRAQALVTVRHHFIQRPLVQYLVDEAQFGRHVIVENHAANRGINRTTWGLLIGKNRLAGQRLHDLTIGSRANSW